MPSKKTRSIPVELQQIKAYELSQQRLSDGREPNSDDDWNDAGKYLEKHPRKVLRWRLEKLRRSIKDFRDVCWKILAFPFWLLWKLPALFSQADTRAFALDIVKTVITAVGLIATFIAGIGLFLNWQSSEKNTELARRNIELTQERLVTERFSKAIEQLGSGKEEVILGGIYSLERIAKDSPKDQATIMEMLSAFIRKNSPVLRNIPNTLISDQPNRLSIKQNKESPKNNSVTITVQSALTVIGRRNHLHWKIHKDYIDLSGANLNGAILDRANLSGAILMGADLNRAILMGANLDRAGLSITDLSGATLSGANLSGADLMAADLSGADLSGADLMAADLLGTNLSGAKNLSAVYRKKHINSAQIKVACYWKEAISDKITLDVLEQDKDSDPKKLVDCSRWKSKN